MKRLILAAFVLVAAAPFYLELVPLGLIAGDRMPPRLFVAVLFWGALALVASRLGQLLLHRYFLRGNGRPPPQLLKNLLGAVIWLVLLSYLMVAEFGVTPSAALATSGLLLAIIGFAVRSLVADLFYGVTIAVERPFEIGDWIELADGTRGQVEEMTWRAVRLITPANLKVVVPHTKLAAEHIINFDQPEPCWRDSEQLTLPYEVTPSQVEQLLLATVREVPDSARINRIPEARITGYNDRGVEWELRYWLPSFDDASRVRQLWQTALLKNLRFAGLRVPRQAEEVYVSALDQERTSERLVADRWIDRVDLFRPLPVAERHRLQLEAERRELAAGETLVQQGESGSSLFVLQSGTCDVLISHDNVTSEVVGVMGTGSVFGELSLLTGSARSATVRAATAVVAFEITKKCLEPLLQQHPDLVLELATILADRRLADEERAELRNGSARGATRQGTIEKLLKGARAFFQLRSPD